MATQYGYLKLPTDSNLVMHLDASDKNSYPGSGNTWFDLTGNGYDGTIVNSIAFSTDGGGSLNFVNDTQYISINNSTAAVFTPNNMTLCCWVKATQISTFYGTLMGKWTGTNAYIFLLGGGLQLDINNDTIIANASFDYVNNWLFCAGTYDRANNIVYVNGVERGRTAGTAAISSNAGVNMILGTNPGGPSGRTLRGFMATATLYSRALSAREILQIYNAQKSRFGLS